MGSAAASGNFPKVAQRLPVRIRIGEGQEMADRLEPGMSVIVRVDTDLAPAVSEVAETVARGLEPTQAVERSDAEPRP